MGNTMQKLQGQGQGQGKGDKPSEEDQQFTCEICIEPIGGTEKKFRNTNKCSHPFCTDCIVKYIRVKLEDDNVGNITCPDVNCHQSLEPLDCAVLVGPELLVRWCDVLCEKAIVGFDRCHCPYRNCNALIVDECGGRVKKSKCPNCKRWICFKCKRVWHPGFRCEDNMELLDVEDLEFGRLVEQRKWMRCPTCRHFVELSAGCNIIKCRCGISFCYKCGRKLQHHYCNCGSRRLSCTQVCVMLMLITLVFCVMYFYGK